MSKIEKLVARFQSKPKDFDYSELLKMLRHFGYIQRQGTGSRVIFENLDMDHKIKLHKPHPGNLLKRYQLDLIEKELKSMGLL